ncbi:MAG: alpha/beta hydrolase [Burkholderiales bacterium]|nr:alpha/beta hydrolase [Burkholderiales bacterium]
MTPSKSLFMPVRGRKYHLRTWGEEAAPALFFLHGAMDTSASFQFVVDALPAGRYCVAPDWCGAGRSELAYCHWFPDYVADLDVLLEALSPGEAADIVGHSRGGNVACLYAGARPERVRRLMSVEGLGFSFASGDLDQGIATCAAWLGEQRERRGAKGYETLDQVAASLDRNNPRLTLERARFLAREWAQRGDDGKWRLASAFFPREKEGVPVSVPQAMAYWRKITAEVRYVWGEASHFTRHCVEHPEDFARRKACFGRWSETEIAGAGHMVQYDQPQRLAREIARFFELDAPAANGVRGAAERMS